MTTVIEFLESEYFMFLFSTAIVGILIPYLSHLFKNYNEKREQDKKDLCDQIEEKSDKLEKQIQENNEELNDKIDTLNEKYTEQSVDICMIKTKLDIMEKVIIPDNHRKIDNNNNHIK